MNRFAVTLIIAAGILPIFSCNDKEDDPLICHVGGTMHPVMKELAKIYEKKTGQAIEINTAGSGELMAYIKGQERGDLYVSHDPFMDILMLKHKVGINAWTVAELIPVIVVQKDNPKKITGLNDLTKPDIRLALTDYEKSTLGRMLPTIFPKAGIDFEELNKKEIAINRKGGYVANLVKMKNADAAIVWNAVAALRTDALDVVEIPAKHLPIPGVDTITSSTKRQYKLTPVRVTVSTLTCSKRLEDSAKFAEFLVSEEASAVFKKFGYSSTTPVVEYVKGEPTEHAKKFLPKVVKEKLNAK